MVMELRKIQVTGGSTHVVSLPKKWVDRTGLGRSDTVAIHEEPDGSLLLIPHSEGKIASRTLTVTLPALPSEEEVVRRLVGAYLAGADEIHVRSASKMDPKVRQIIRDITRDLVGVEILEESANAMTLQDLVGVADMDLRKTLSRMQRIARIMYDDAVMALQARDIEAAQSVAQRDDELDRLLWMVSKQMHALLERPRPRAHGRPRRQDVPEHRRAQGRHRAEGRHREPRRAGRHGAQDLGRRLHQPEAPGLRHRQRGGGPRRGGRQMAQDLPRPRAR